MLTEISTLVEEACYSKNNIFGYGIWTHHIVDVIRFGKQLAKKWNADEEIVELAALLHDYSSIKVSKYYKEHHIHSQTLAQEILEKYNYPQDRIDIIKQCIKTHRGSISIERIYVEAECLANADAMSHIEQAPSLLYAAFVRKGMDIDEGADWVKNKIKRSWHKLNPEIQETMQPKYNAILKILSKS